MSKLGKKETNKKNGYAVNLRKERKAQAVKKLAMAGECFLSTLRYLRRVMRPKY